MKKRTFLRILFLLLFVSQLHFVLGQKPVISIISENAQDKVALHGIEKLTGVLQEKQIPFEVLTSGADTQGKFILITGTTQAKGLVDQLLKNEKQDISQTNESFIIRKTIWKGKPALVACGYDNKGLMYALLDITLRTSWSSNPSDPFQFIEEANSSPDIKERGIAMYTMHRRYWEDRFYDKNFWARYFDMMAQNRLNMLEILFGYENGGFMAPCYPYFFNVEGYPDVKMKDITDEQQKYNIQTMKQVIQMAHDRGVGIRLGVWDHIYRGKVQAGGNPDFEYDPNHALPWQVTGLDSTNLNTYTKLAFAKFLKTFPELDAILFKTNNESGLKTSELHEFSVNFFETVKATAPDMLVDIHSKGITDTLINTAIKLGLNFRIAPKFWMEQIGLPFSPTHINREDQKNRRHGYADMLRYPQHYQMLWKLWNGGSTRVLLWGDPGYVKRFAQSSHLYNSDAYAIYEPLATKMESQWHDVKPFELLKPEDQYYDYEFERYWHFFQTWGLVGYDSNTPEIIWDKEFEKRFGEKAGPIIKSALHEASWVLPRIVAACYPYSFFPTTSAWPEKQRLGDLPLYASAEGSDLQQFASFKEEALVLLGQLETAKTLPSTTSLWLATLSENILKKVKEAEDAMATKNNKEFNSTSTDLKILANLALYHSRRVPAAVSYCLFLQTKDVLALDKAIEYEQGAIKAWQQIVEAAGETYPEKILIGKVPLSGHWKDELASLQKGLEKLKSQRADFKPEGSVLKSPEYRLASDADHSAYFNINHTPLLTATIGEPVTVKVKISSPNGLKWVRLQYRSMNQYKDFEMLPMTETNEKNTFEAVIPANKIDRRYDLMYLIEMMDMNGKGFIYPDLNKETPYTIVHLITP